VSPAAIGPGDEAGQAGAEGGPGDAALADESTGPEEALPPRMLGLLAVLVATAFFWSGVLALPLSGEDYYLLARVRQGEMAFPYLYRPLPHLLLMHLHDAFGAIDALPYHAASLLLHVLVTAIVFWVALTLWRSGLVALLSAAVFGLGAGVADSVAWVAAGNRPLAGVGGALAIVGLLKRPQFPVSSVVLLLGGLGLQLHCTDEAYGTALMAIGWLLLSDVFNAPKRRTSALVLVGIITAGLLYHAFFLLELPGGKEAATMHGLPMAQYALRVRLIDLAAGLGLNEAFGLLVCCLGAVALGVRLGWNMAGFVLLLLVTSCVPYAFADASAYRHYPTQLPFALLVGALPALFVGRPGLGGRSNTAHGVAYGLAAALVVAASQAPRNARLQAWAEASQETALAAEAGREYAGEDADGELPLLVNVDGTTRGPFVEAFELDLPSDVDLLSFLDTATGYLRPSSTPPGPWWGRRWDGTYGEIDPETYFTGRPALPEMRLYGTAVVVGSPEEALLRLRDGSVDLQREIVVELPEGRLLPSVFQYGSRSGSQPGKVEVLKGFVLDEREARADMTVRVYAERPVLFAVQREWMFGPRVRLAPEERLVADAADARFLSCEAQNLGTGSDMAVYRVNAYGTAVFVPQGVHDIAIAWHIRPRLAARGEPPPPADVAVWQRDEGDGGEDEEAED